MAGKIVGEPSQQPVDRRKELRLKGRPVRLHPTIEIPQAGDRRVRKLRVLAIVAKPP